MPIKTIKIAFYGWDLNKKRTITINTFQIHGKQYNNNKWYHNYTNCWWFYHIIIVKKK